MSRVIVGVSGSPGCLPAMRYAAELARAHEAPLLPVMAWMPPGGEVADRSTPSVVLRQVWADVARQQLHAALQAAFGGLLPDVPTQPHVIRGEPGRCLVKVACEEGDLLVIGTGRRSWIGRLWHAGVSRYCLAHASCPVLAIPPSPLDRELTGLRGWALRRRALSPADITAGPAPAAPKDPQ
jgi:nucleotide-binding universal stress UspA family protein